MADAWAQHLEEILQLDPAARRAGLIELCVSADNTVLPSSGSSRPPSRPASELVRLAGADLLAEGFSDRTVALGLVFAHWKRERSDPLDAEHWEFVDRARAIAARGADRLFESWLLATGSSQLHNTQRSGEALEFAEAALRALRATGPEDIGPFVDARTLLGDQVDPEMVRSVVGYYTWSAVRKARRYTGDLDGWREAIEEGAAVSLPALEYRPSLYAAALKASYDLQRSLGTQPDLSSLDNIRHRSPSLESSYLAQVAYNAEARGDRAGALEGHRARLDFLLGQRYADLVGATPETIAARMAELSLPERRHENSIANSSYEMAVNLMESGRAWTNSHDRAVALFWLSLSTTLWSGWGTNGLRAANYRRSILRIAEDPTVVADLLEIARFAPRPGLRINAMCRTAEMSTTHREEVIAQLDSMINEPLGAGRARLLATRAWITRPGTESYDRRSTEDANEVFTLLPSKPAGSLEYLAKAAHVLAAGAELDGDVAAQRGAIREGLMAVGRMILNATTPEQRIYLAGIWSPTIRAALDFAERYADADLADLTAEIVRRDGIGTLLAGVAANPLTPTESAEAAAGANSADRKDGEALTSGTETTAPSDDGDEEGNRRARDAGDDLIGEQNVAAYEAAEKLLGPLGSLVDPGSLYAARAAALVGMIPNTKPVFVLQLLPSTIPLITSLNGPRLYRRLTWRDSDGAHEIVDSVDLPAGLIDEPRPDDLRIWTDPAALFPPPLTEALLRSTPQSPLRLLVIPTGLFHIQFDCLWIGAHTLLEVALTSIHTSLTAVQHALSTTSDAPAAGSMAVFDTERLPATKREHQALKKYFPEVLDPTDIPGLRALNNSDRTLILFAFGVHGTDDDKGWGQLKQFPDGTWMSAAEALTFRYPELCVLASCYSRVRIEGVGHAGFPTAMFARGARTIIGSIGKLYDTDTSHILKLFYAELAATGNPVAALRSARLEWIAQEPHSRRDAYETWGRLVVYGGAHH